MTVKRWEHMADMLIRLMATASLVAVIFLGYQQHRSQECFQRYADAQAVTTAARANAAEQDRQAQSRLYMDIATRPEHSIAALNAYLRSQRETDSQRAKNPIPPPPSAVC